MRKKGFNLVFRFVLSSDGRKVLGNKIQMRKKGFNFSVNEKDNVKRNYSGA